MAAPSQQGPPQPSPLPNRRTPPAGPVLHLVGAGKDPGTPGYGRGHDASPAARAKALAGAADPPIQATAPPDAAAAGPAQHVIAATAPIDAAAAEPAKMQATAPPDGRSPGDEDKLQWYSHHAKVSTKNCPEVWVPRGTRLWKYDNTTRTYSEEVAGE